MNSDLTPREQAVAELVAQGVQNSLIAKELGISVETVKRHLSNGMDKSGMSNRTEFAVWWLSQTNRLDSAPIDLFKLRLMVARCLHSLHALATELGMSLDDVDR